MDKKTVLAIFLATLLVAGYQYFFVKEVPPRGEEQTVSQTDTGGTDATQEPIIREGGEVLVDTETVTASSDEQAVVVDGPLYTAAFSTRGASLKSFRLKDYRQELEKDSESIELVASENGALYPLGFSFDNSSVTLPPDVTFQAERDSVELSGTEAQKLTFSRVFPDKIAIEKTFTFHPDKYGFDLDVTVRNISPHAYKQKAVLTWNQYANPDVKSSRYDHIGPIWYVRGGTEKENVDDIEGQLTAGPDVSWVAFESKYFLSAMIPEQPSLTRLEITKDKRDIVSSHLIGPSNIVLPDQSTLFRYRMYLGPKDYELLKAENVELEESINFGSWMKWLALPLLTALKFIHAYVPNYGMAIIILTVIIKILFWPLGNMSYRSMKNMQKLQPQMQKLREKYKNDKARLNQEVMALYKVHKVNPMGGCFPILIQLPVFIGLYRALIYSIELRHSPFIFWIQDLSAKDPYYITPIVMGATMFLQQRMTPTPGGNEMQAKMMMWMPVIFTFLFLSFPSGLVIYWLFNNILSIGQQYFINKRAD